MLLVKLLEGLGDIRGSMYDFEKSGDILGKHNHTDDNVHITIVAKGKIKAYSHDWEMEAVAGQLLDFRPNEPHEIMALEDNTRIFNIVKKFGGQNFTAPHLIVTPKGVVHQFIAKEPHTIFCCIHAIRDGSDVDAVASQDITPEQAFELMTQYPLTQA